MSKVDDNPLTSQIQTYAKTDTVLYTQGSDILLSNASNLSNQWDM